MGVKGIRPEDHNQSVANGQGPLLRWNDGSNYISFPRKYILDAPSGPDPKPHPSTLRKQGSRKKTHRRPGSRFRVNDGLGISGEKNYQASLTGLSFGRCALRGVKSRRARLGRQDIKTGVHPNFLIKNIFYL